MTALEKAVAWQNQNSKHPFLDRLAWNMQHGVVHCSEHLFVMGHPLTYNPKTQTINMNKPPNAWFVELAAVTQGTANPIATLFRLATHPLHYVLWLRRGIEKPHVYLWDKLASKFSFTSERGIA